MSQTAAAERRQALLERLPSDALALVPAAPVHHRNRDVEFPYRQTSDVLYLAGFPEPEALLVLAPGRAAGEFLMFCRARDTDQETWAGRRAGPEGAVEAYGADEAWTLEELEDVLLPLLGERHALYYDIGAHPEWDPVVLDWLQQLRGAGRRGLEPPRQIVSLAHELHELRLIKSEHELETMARAADIAATAHRRAMAHCRPGLYEFELEADFQHEFRRSNAVPSYPPIVGGGANACILHYTTNAARLEAGDLVLIDAGAEYAGYASDITRTFPVSGRFSDPQRRLYDLVLRAQRSAIDAVRPGNAFDAPHRAALEVLVDGLISLGLLSGEPEDRIEDESYKRFFMHRTSHWIGMDVHDVGRYKIEGAWRPLEPGMVLTIEPGLYIPPDAEDIPAPWPGLGIRIEDDVVVTDDEPRVLSATVPKDPEAIEAIMAEGEGRRS
jgi:Xaa-Pro aminopeptidase